MYLHVYYHMYKNLYTRSVTALAYSLVRFTGSHLKNGSRCMKLSLLMPGSCDLSLSRTWLMTRRRYVWNVLRRFSTTLASYNQSNTRNCCSNRTPQWTLLQFDRILLRIWKLIWPFWHIFVVNLSWVNDVLWKTINLVCFHFLQISLLGIIITTGTLHLIEKYQWN